MDRWNTQPTSSPEHFQHTQAPEPEASQPHPKRKSGLWWKLPLSLMLGCCIFLGGVLGYIVATLYQELPAIDELGSFRPSSISRMYDRNGVLIGEFFREKRIPISLQTLPEHVYYASIAVEDATFFEHGGLDFQGIIRAATKNFQAGRVVEGGSTITQQLAKTMFLTSERKLTRKIKEAFLAFKIDSTLEKQHILELYLNQIYYGRGAYGIEAAAQNFFNKSAHELTVAEAAMLAGMPKAPSRYSRDINDAETQQRWRHVLNRMREERAITESQFDEAINTPLAITGHIGQLNDAPYVSDFVRNAIIEKHGEDLLYREGVSIYTTVDIRAQHVAHEAITKAKQEYIQRREGRRLPHELTPEDIQFALLSIDNHDGAIIAMVGGTDFYTNQFNRAMNGQRQTGSAFKPFVYSAALEKGLSPATIMVDAPMIFPSSELVWKPENYTQRFYGPTSLRNAVAQSLNVVAVKVLQEVGIGTAIDHVRRLGITAPINRDLSIALGSSSVTLLELTRAYSIFPAEGRRHEPYLIQRVVDRDGKVIEEHIPSFEQAISPQVAYVMTSMLQSVITDGTGRSLRSLPMTLAGKTGTTNAFNDAWFFGFTPRYTTGVWTGFDVPRTMGHGEAGARSAAPVFAEFAKNYFDSEPAVDFPVPEGVVFRRIDPTTGQLAREGAPNSIMEVFVAGTEPRDVSTGSTQDQMIDLFQLRGGDTP
ncbi:penicillin-binding protein 1A [Chrysiogenes arsenatis]|uniref:penicillin-binding protein 1A n=1 Tax=Chrysiogenes arsenatis TaxID=309797 RepID=UPI00042060BE|nr:PBP1A family penicillin-binding protein [Chrysiogenes arsenatis]